MLSASSFSLPGKSFTSLLILTIACVVGLNTSCGSGASKGPQFSGNTKVTVVLSNTANDQLSAFGIVLNAITLTQQSGATVNLLPSPQSAEFMTVNGGGLPLVTTDVPQDIYTAAAVTVGYAQFTCVTLASSGNWSVVTYADQQAGSVTINFPSPVTVTGTGMGLAINLQVSQSASFPAPCYVTGPAQWTITPTFNVTAISLPGQPAENGRVAGLRGEITAIATNSNSFTMSNPIVDRTCPCVQPDPLTISVDSSTEYGGIGSSSALAIGTLIDIDGAIQPDGSLRATRVAAYDPGALNEMTGPLLFLDAQTPAFYSFGRQENGQTYSVHPQSLGIYSFSNTTAFQISGELSDVTSLPFAATFDGSNMVAGQNVGVFSQQITDYSGGQHTAATSIVLMPQTINATVLGSSTIGNFTDYTVSLAPYDLFPTFAVQPGQSTRLNSPSQVEVYVDSNTRRFNMQALAAGSTLRFYGLVFNDNGTLRMDCAQIDDGVPFTSSSTAMTSLEVGESRVVRQEQHGGMPVIITVNR